MIAIWQQSPHQSKVLIGALLLLLLCLVTYSSNGIIRSGGDEDGGSGLGGTGRRIDSLQPGGSGFGGTGFRPYLGFADTESAATLDGDINMATNAPLLIVDQPQLGNKPIPQPIAASVAGTIHDLPRQEPLLGTALENPVTVVNPTSITHDSAPVTIAEAIQWELDSQVIALNSTLDVVAGANLETDIETNIEAGIETNIETNTEAKNLPTNSHGENTLAATLASKASTPARDDQISWSDLAQHLSHNPRTQPRTQTDTVDSGIPPVEQAIMQRPDRVIRPALPPIQGIRPVQRAGLLPPRIRPLRL